MAWRGRGYGLLVCVAACQSCALAPESAMATRLSAPPVTHASQIIDLPDIPSQEPIVAFTAAQDAGSPDEQTAEAGAPTEAGEAADLKPAALEPLDLHLPINLATALRLSDARPLVIAAAQASAWVA